MRSLNLNFPTTTFGRQQPPTEPELTDKNRTILVYSEDKMSRGRGVALFYLLGLVSFAPAGNTRSLKPDSHEHLGPLIPSQSLPLVHLFNNIASGPKGDFDKAGSAFPADVLPTGEYVYDRIKVSLSLSNSKGLS